MSTRVFVRAGAPVLSKRLNDLLADIDDDTVEMMKMMHLYMAIGRLIIDKENPVSFHRFPRRRNRLLNQDRPSFHRPLGGLREEGGGG